MEVRFNALSRPIENALQKEGIPCRILGGHKFFERMEVLCIAFPSEWPSQLFTIGQRPSGLLTACRQRKL